MRARGPAPEEREPVMPFGHNKGVLLKHIATGELERTREWCREKDDGVSGSRFQRLIEAIDDELESRLGLPLFPKEELRGR